MPARLSLRGAEKGEMRCCMIDGRLETSLRCWPHCCWEPWSLCSDDDDNGRWRGLPPLADGVIAEPDGVLRAQIRRTTGGIPHITANTLESAGYGAGYAQAQDNVCIIADEILKARGERARFYGPGDGNANIISDFRGSARSLRRSCTRTMAWFPAMPAASCSPAGQLSWRCRPGKPHRHCQRY